MDDGRKMEGEADVRGQDRAPDRLALGADVEQSGPERQPDAEPGADQRRRLGGGLGDRHPAADRALDQRRVRAGDLLPRGTRWRRRAGRRSTSRWPAPRCRRRSSRSRRPRKRARTRRSWWPRPATASASVQRSRSMAAYEGFWAGVLLGWRALRGRFRLISLIGVSSSPPSASTRSRAAASSAASSSAADVVAGGGHRLLGRYPGHHQAEHLAGGVRADDADDLAAIHHRDPVGQRRRPRPARSRRSAPRCRGRARRPAAGAGTRSRRRRRRGSAGWRSAPTAGATARGPARPSAGCRRTTTRPGCRSTGSGCRTPRRARLALLRIRARSSATPLANGRLVECVQAPGSRPP